MHNTIQWLNFIVHYLKMKMKQKIGWDNWLTTLYFTQMRWCVEKWDVLGWTPSIFDSNYEKALVLNRKYLDTICAPSVGEKEMATFEIVFCDVRYICSTAHPK